MVNKKNLIVVLIIALLATSMFAASFDVQYKTNNTGTTNNTISVCLKIVNNSGATVAMNTLKVRYYYTKEGTAAEQFTCDYAQIGNSLVNGSFATPGYLEIGFTGGSINNASNSGEIQTRTNKTDWSNYDQSNDYSFVASTTYASNSKICLYQNGNLVWGTPSGVTTGPTPTPGGSTPPAGVGRVSVSPASQSAAIGARPVINLLVNSGTQMVAAYGVTVTYPSNLLSVASADVVAGAQGFVSAVNTNTAGSIVASGFDTAGKGPGSALDLLKITFTANAAGTATIGLTVQTLTDAAYANIGTPSAAGGTITITGTVTTPPRTATRTATTSVIVTTPPAGVGRVSVSPASQSVAVGARPVINLLVNSGTQMVAAYGVTVTYPSNLLSVASADVVAGAQGFVSAVNTNTAGSIVASGFDTAGKGPGSALDLLKITFTANAAGTATIGLTVQTLTDAAYANVGTPSAAGGTITITGTVTTPPRTATRTATAVVTTPVVTTPPAGVGRVSVSPASQSVAVGARPVINLLVNSGTQMVAAYGVTVTYPSNLLSVASADVVAGAQGFVSAVNTNTAGSIVASGFDTTGKGPGSALDLLKITFTANAAGTATIGLTIQSLTDGAYANIGTPSAVGGTITITGTVTTPPRTATRTATAVVTTPVVTTPPAGVGRVSVSPASQTVAVGARPVINLLVNSGTQMVASYGVTVTYPSNILAVVAADVVAGAQGFVSAVNANTAGSIVASGFDTTGKGPGAALDLVKITFTANAAGTATIGLTVQTLTDGAYANIGTPSGVGGTITVTGTVTATRTATVAPTATPVPTATRTATVAPTATRTATVAPTATRTATVAPTATRTATVAPTATRTATVAPTATRTATVAPTATRTATVAPTATRTATVAPTATPVANVVGMVSLLPASQTAARSSTVNQNVAVNTGTELCAAYGITIAYPSNMFSVTASAVTAGAQGYVSATNANTAGSLVISGFDTAGKGPSTTLALLNIAWTSLTVTGTATFTLTVQTLTNASYANIGTPTGSTATVTLN